jgi:hypothetical protein
MLAAGRSSGAIAWWASPRLAFTFFRPLSSLLHYVEFTGWPGAPWLMSLVNVLVYAGCVLFAALLYRDLADLRVRGQRDFAARVESSTETGMPQRVRFSFPNVLEAVERQWLVWEGKNPAAFAPLAIGERVRLAAMSPLDALSR